MGGIVLMVFLLAAASSLSRAAFVSLEDFAGASEKSFNVSSSTGASKRTFVTPSKSYVQFFLPPEIDLVQGTLLVASYEGYGSVDWSVDCEDREVFFKCNSDSDECFVRIWYKDGTDLVPISSPLTFSGSFATNNVLLSSFNAGASPSDQFTDPRDGTASTVTYVGGIAGYTCGSTDQVCFHLGAQSAQTSLYPTQSLFWSKQAPFTPRGINEVGGCSAFNLQQATVDLGATTTIQAPPCSHVFVPQGESDYCPGRPLQYHNLGLTKSIWDEANAACVGAGWNLPSFRNQLEWDDFVTYLAGQGITQAIWIGMRQAAGSPEPTGGWASTSGDPSATWTNWDAGEPNEWPWPGQSAENCAGTRPTSLKWNDMSCDVNPGEITNNHVICQQVI